MKIIFTDACFFITGVFAYESLLRWAGRILDYRPTLVVSVFCLIVGIATNLT